MTFTCPRRLEFLAYQGDRENEDQWIEPGPKGREHPIIYIYRTCSYCGSIHPEDLFKAIERGYTLGPTDKSYKVYIDYPKPEDYEWFTEKNETGGTSSWGSHQLTYKFYFQHLDELAQHRFIKLLNEDKIKIGEPGFFYVNPFFVKYE